MSISRPSCPPRAPSHSPGEVGKDPRLVEVILSESLRVVRKRPDLLIVEHRLGFVMANAGVDQSNVGRAGRACSACCCCRAIPTRARQHCASGCGADRRADGVVINDSFGRAWRRGTVGVALGAAGLPALIDLRGRPDLFGRTLEVSIIGFADEIAAAASLLMGQADEGAPGRARARPRTGPARHSPAASLVRPAEEDLFR